MTTTETHPTARRGLFPSASALYIPREDGRVLLVLHGRSGRWVLAGGKGEAGESPRCTAEREGREELGVSVRVGRLLVFNWMTATAELWPGAAQHAHAYPCHMFTFLGELDQADRERIEIPRPELLDWRWWDPEEIAASGLMEPYNARNLLTAAAVYRDEEHAAYLES